MFAPVLFSGDVDGVTTSMGMGGVDADADAEAECGEAAGVEESAMNEGEGKRGRGGARGTE